MASRIQHKRRFTNRSIFILDCLERTNKLNSLNACSSYGLKSTFGSLLDLFAPWWDIHCLSLMRVFNSTFDFSLDHPHSQIWTQIWEGSKYLEMIEGQVSAAMVQNHLYGEYVYTYSHCYDFCVNILHTSFGGGYQTGTLVYRLVLVLVSKNPPTPDWYDLRQRQPHTNVYLVGT
jgi:hypothetical protein